MKHKKTNNFPTDPSDKEIICNYNINAAIRQNEAEKYLISHIEMIHPEPEESSDVKIDFSKVAVQFI